MVDNSFQSILNYCCRVLKHVCVMSHLVSEEIESMCLRAFIVYAYAILIQSPQSVFFFCPSSSLVAHSAFRHTDSLDFWTAGLIFYFFLTTSISAAYEGFSTFRPVAVAVKHLWNRSSGSGGWLSQSSFLLMKCFLNPCGPETQVALP